MAFSSIFQLEATYMQVIGLLVMAILSLSLAEEEKLFFKLQIPGPETVGSLGQGLVLDCEAGGSPAPTIHWLKNGERIPQVKKYFCLIT